MSNIDWNNSAMKIIAASGIATSMAVESFKFSKNGKYAEASQLLSDANKSLGEAIDEHLLIIKAQKSGVEFKNNILILHAEAQMTSCQTMIIMANEIINVYEEIHKRSK